MKTDLMESQTTPEPVDFASGNALLFDRRQALMDEIAELEPKVKRSSKARVRLPRARKELSKIETEIIELNRGLVISYARKFASRGRSQDMEDFEAAGTAGLVAAMKSYDPEKGPFAQWAYHPIQRAVTRAVRDADHPNMNPGDFERRPDVLRAVERLRDKGTPITPDAVATEAGTTIGQVRRVLEAPRLVSADLPVGEHGEGTLSELIADVQEDIADQIASSMAIGALERYAFDVLDLREMYVVTKHYGLDGEEPQKLATIGARLNLSREAARQIEAKALAKLSHPLVLNKLVHYRDVER